jgi:hypothetical protein
MYFGTMKKLTVERSSWIWPFSSGIFAITMWMMLSVRSWSPPEMKIFVPVSLIGAVRLLDGARFHQAQIGAAIGLGQAHRAGPFAGHHLGNDVLLHPGCAGGDQRAIGGP